MADGDRYELCLHCKYPGYAGGLWVGSQDGSGFLWVPAKPPEGFPSLNLFCAQDESIRDEDEGLEYDAGWSENLGRGDDGVRLEYRGGAVVSDGSGGGDLVLRSVNGRGCHEVTKLLLWPRGVGYVVVSTTLRNVCDHPKRLSFYTGDDPWIGRYKTSDGDVGWTAAGLVRTEAAIDPTTFRHGGLYDLGNALLGQSSAPFSNVASFIALDPTLPPPSVVLFANAFAHDPAEVDPSRPLDNRSMTALNIGWRGVVLEPGGALRVRYALGRATSGEPGTTPTIPEIPRRHWQLDEAVSGGKVGAGRRGPLPLRFESETIHVSLDPPLLRVEAEYVFRNRLTAPYAGTMFYPFPLDEEHPYPTEVEVDGAPFHRHERGLLWRLHVPPLAEARVRVRYTQPTRSQEARYILTSTSRWGEPLAHAEYRVDWPAALEGVTVSYEGEQTVEEGRRVLRFARDDFQPERDIVVSWGGAGAER